MFEGLKVPRWSNLQSVFQTVDNKLIVQEFRNIPCFFKAEIKTYILIDTLP